MTPQQASDWLLLLPVRVQNEIIDAEMATATTGRAIAHAQTMGPFKTAFLRKHRPGLYSRNKPRPPADPALINSQSGVLAQGWRHRQGMRASGDVVTVIENDSESAKWIAGSGMGRSKMMRRPVEERIAERLTPIRMENLKDALRRALST
jgi:hypothetical protein